MKQGEGSSPKYDYELFMKTPIKTVSWHSQPPSNKNIPNPSPNLKRAGSEKPKIANS